jgi:tRNA A37 threonylcarbamoyladenosine modification protein TsaB
MILYINTIEKDKVIIALKKGNLFFVKKTFKTKYNESERLIPEIKKFLENKKIVLKKIKKIEVENISKKDTGFTALRIGVVIANALAYGLNIPVESSGDNFSKKKKSTFSVFDKNKIYIVEPIYNKEPNITKKKE